MQKCHRRECGGRPACDRAWERTVLPGSGPFLPAWASPCPSPALAPPGGQGQKERREGGHADTEGGREGGVNALGLHNTEALSRAASAL